MSNPFSGPSSSTGIQWEDFKGALLIFKVHALESGIKTVHGEAQAVRADVIVLDGAHAGEKYEDTLVFPKVLISQIKTKTGGMVLGRLGQGQKKPGQSAPWTISEPTPDDVKVGMKWLEANTEAPF